MEITVQFTAQLPVKLSKKDKWYVASCRILDVYSQGDTEEKAKKNLGDVLSLFFVSCFERGTLDVVLKNCGFRAVRTPHKPSKKSMVSREDYIDVPIPFLVNQDNAITCHA